MLTNVAEVMCVVFVCMISLLFFFRTKWTLSHFKTRVWETKPNASRRLWGGAQMNRLLWVQNSTLTLLNNHYKLLENTNGDSNRVFSCSPPFFLNVRTCCVTGSDGSIPAHWARSEELEGGCGDEEPTDTPAREEDLWSGESGRLK